jgi:hypothetical protein
VRVVLLLVVAVAVAHSMEITPVLAVLAEQDLFVFIHGD